jgi:5'(3')-deoxyribonucleotidase
MNKRILVDCDGVLLNWEAGFANWMDERGYVKVDDHDVTAYGLHIHYGIPRDEVQRLVTEFNHSASIGFLEPTHNAPDVLRRLYYDNFNIVVITSLCLHPHSKKLREYNLQNVFKYVEFEDVICLDVGADKTEELKKWVGNASYWVEDKQENARIGKELGFKSYLMAHPHNYEEEGIKRVNDWHEIYHDITTI